MPTPIVAQPIIGSLSAVMGILFAHPYYIPREGYMSDLRSIITFICDADRHTTGQSIVARRLISIELLLAALASKEAVNHG